VLNRQVAHRQLEQPPHVRKVGIPDKWLSAKPRGVRRWADPYQADLGGADLSYATLVRTNLERANLTGCSVYGISAWNIRLEEATQSNLVITPKDESVIQVDNLEVAQFVYLLLNNERIRSVIDTITSKVVLILGRFTAERKTILDAIRVELRMRNYLPILFDFQKPESRDLTGTVTTLANMARFIIADVTDPSSSPYELGRIVPNTKVPLQRSFWMANFHSRCYRKADFSVSRAKEEPRGTPSVQIVWSAR
jgi:hypothetical protein